MKNCDDDDDDVKNGMTCRVMSGKIERKEKMEESGLNGTRCSRITRCRNTRVFCVWVTE